MLLALFAIAVYFWLHAPKTASQEYIGGAHEVELVELPPVEPEKHVLPKLEDELKKYLESKKSPLAPYAKELIAQPNWKRIVAITSIESSFCRRQVGFNCWGIKARKGGYVKYSSFSQAIVDANRVMEKYKGKTYKQMMGVYVVPGSPNWLNLTTRTDNELEQIIKRTAQ